MKRRAEVHAAIEANREAQQQQRNETFIPLTSLKRPSASKPTQSPTPTLRPVLMAVATSGGGIVNQHFGHAREFLIYEAATTTDDVAVRFIGARKVDLYCGGGDTCGDAETALAGSIRTLNGCEVVLCSKIGYEPWGDLEAAGILPNGEHAMEPIEDAVAAVYREMASNGRLDAATDATALSA